MERRDGIQTELQFLRMENVRLTNEKAGREEYIRFLEEENKTVEKEIRQEFEMKLALMARERDNALRLANAADSRVKAAEDKARKSEARAVQADQMLGEAREALAESNRKIALLTEKLKSQESLKEIADAANSAALNARQVVELINRRIFQRNSDATRFLNDEIDPNCPLLEENGLADIVRHVMTVTGDNGRPESVRTSLANPVQSRRGLPRGKAAGKKSSSPVTPQVSRNRRIYTATVLERMGIDASNLPAGAKLIRRKDKVTGEDV